MSLTPSLRYYTQSAASFYVDPPFGHGFIPVHPYSADTRLTAFGALSAGLDLALGLIRQLVTVGPEQLDAIVVIGIVRSGDHDAEIGAQRPCQHGDGRRRQGTEEKHIDASRKERNLPFC